MDSTEQAQTEAVLRLFDRLAETCQELTFSLPVAWVYNPLLYAREAHRSYIVRYLTHRPKVIFMGMNPGPYGMAQTGIPFGEVHTVREWLKIGAGVSRPAAEHPKRGIEGFGCRRSEVSGKRLWGLFRERFVTPERFFSDHFVINYCPLLFLSESGSNVTPVQVKNQERERMIAVCDRFLLELMTLLSPLHVIGIGQFAAERARQALASRPEIGVTSILHPSPANPLANRDWPGSAVASLKDLGIWS